MAAGAGGQLGVQLHVDDNKKASLLFDEDQSEEKLYATIEEVGIDWCKAYRKFDDETGLQVGDHFGGTLLHVCVWATSLLTMLRLLLEIGVPVNAPDDKGSTVLHLACSLNLYEDREDEHFNDTMDRTVRMLIAGGANMTAKNFLDETPLELALRNKSSGALRFFTELIGSMAPLWNASKRRQKDRNGGEAFAMGHHDRLGSESLVRHLDPCIIRIILEFAGKLDGAQ